MATATWNVDVNGTQHTVVLTWTYFGGERTVTVDGVEAADSGIPFRWKSDQTIDVDGQEMRVVTRPQALNTAAFDVELHIGDRVLHPDIDDR